MQSIAKVHHLLIDVQVLAELLKWAADISKTGSSCAVPHNIIIYLKQTV